MRALSEQCVVITGGSSGIGRCTATRLGHRGASVALLARNREALEEAAKEVVEAGGQALVVTADVADWGQVEGAAKEVLQRFGRIDGWVNNAGVSVYAEFEALEPEEMRRVVEVNLLGQMYGTKAALEAMRQHGEGVIVNVSSALARRSVPLQSAYCASKHGVTGFTESLRMELQERHPGILVAEVLPSSIDTPLFTHARSKVGYKPMPIPPIYDPVVVAEAIVKALEEPQREIFAGGSGKLLEVGQRLSPGLVDAYLQSGQRGVKQQLTDRADDAVDNLFEPSRGRGAMTGDWGSKAKHASVYTQAMEYHPWRKVALAGAAIGAAALAARGVFGLGR